MQKSLSLNNEFIEEKSILFKYGKFAFAEEVLSISFSSSFVSIWLFTSKTGTPKIEESFFLSTLNFNFLSISFTTKITSRPSSKRQSVRYKLRCKLFWSHRLMIFLYFPLSIILIETSSSNESGAREYMPGVSTIKKFSPPIFLTFFFSSTVTPCQLPTCSSDFVKLLKSVVLPEFGFPTNKISSITPPAPVLVSTP